MKEILFESILKENSLKDYEDVGDIGEDYSGNKVRIIAKGFEKELKELMNKYKVLGFCCDWNSMSVGFDDGSEHGKWFDVYGEGDKGISVSASTLEIDV